MRSIGWIGVLLGTAVALMLGRFLIWIMPDLYGLIADEAGGGNAATLSVARQTVADVLSMFSWVVLWALAYFFGGVVAGRLARNSAGFNGAITAVCGGIFGVGSFLLAVGPINAVTDSENLALTSLHAMVFSMVFLPTTVLASYFGGKVGGRLGSRTVNRAFD